jgi:uncharacterized damage-inducible protein DinB
MGVNALISLHSLSMREFVETWKKAKEMNLRLPLTEDKDYESLESLLFHVLRSSRNYITWICDKLKINDPDIMLPPDMTEIEEKSQEYLEYLLQKWDLPLKNITSGELDLVFNSNWGVPHSIESMLEHAVMHPIRHSFQLKNRIENNDYNIL